MQSFFFLPSCFRLSLDQVAWFFLAPLAPAFVGFRCLIRTMVTWILLDQLKKELRCPRYPVLCFDYASGWYWPARIFEVGWSNWLGFYNFFTCFYSVFGCGKYGRPAKSCSSRAAAEIRSVASCLCTCRGPPRKTHFVVRVATSPTPFR